MRTGAQFALCSLARTPLRRRPIFNRCATLRFEYHLRQRRIAAVRDAQRNALHALAFGEFPGLSMKRECGLPARQPRDFEIHPANASAPSGAKRFHPRFFRRKTPGVAFEAVAVSLAIFDLGGSKYTFQKCAAMPLDAQPEDHAVLASRDELQVAFARHYTWPSPVKMERAAAEARWTFL